jgi:hypothetical protein
VKLDLAFSIIEEKGSNELGTKEDDQWMDTTRQVGRVTPYISPGAKDAYQPAKDYGCIILNDDCNRVEISKHEQTWYS